MSQPSTPSKRERREAARAERRAGEAAATAGAARRRRLSILGGLLAAAVVIVVAAILISSSGGGGGGDATENLGTGGSLVGAAETEKLFAGVPQDGVTLGRADAPVTIVEFADPQCPFCKDFAVDELPQLVRDYVRTGKAKLELRVLPFLGPDSITAGRVLEAAGLQDKLWNAIDLMYRNQGEENTGYIDDAYLRTILGGVSGLDVDKAMSEAASTQVSEVLGTTRTLQSRYAVDSTPTILVGPTGGDLTADTEGAPTAAGIGKLVDAARAKSS